MEVNRRLNQVPRTELERRWAIVRNRLDAIGCDMLIAVGAHNTWSGGMNRWLTDYMVTYRRVVLFHRTDDMTIVEHGTMDGYRRPAADHPRADEHTSELQSLMRISYAVFCLKKKR